MKGGEMARKGGEVHLLLDDYTKKYIYIIFKIS